MSAQELPPAASKGDDCPPHRVLARGRLFLGPEGQGAGALDGVECRVDTDIPLWGYGRPGFPLGIAFSPELDGFMCQHAPAGTLEALKRLRGAARFTSLAHLRQLIQGLHGVQTWSIDVAFDPFPSECYVACSTNQPAQSCGLFIAQVAMRPCARWLRERWRGMTQKESSPKLGGKSETT